MQKSPMELDFACNAVPST
jgi:hypothetical protein